MPHIKAFSFLYPYNLTTVFEPWRKHLRDGYDKVIADLTERDRHLEDHLNINVAQGYLAYAPRTSNFLVLSAATTDVPNLTATVTVPANRRLKLTAHARIRNEAGVVANAFFKIRESGVTIGEHLTALLQPVGAAGDMLDSTVISYVSPTPGDHTYYVSVQFPAGGGSINAEAVNPAYIAVEDIANAGRF